MLDDPISQECLVLWERRLSGTPPAQLAERRKTAGRTKSDQVGRAGMNASGRHASDRHTAVVWDRDRIIDV